MPIPILDYNQFTSDGAPVKSPVSYTSMVSRGKFLGHSGTWFAKMATDPEIARHELIAQEFFRLIIPHQPETRIAKDEALETYYVYSQEVQGYRTLPLQEKHFVDGTITGFGQAILVSAFLQEVDLKNGNIGVDENNRVIKIDGDQCLASVLGVKEKFDLTPRVIAELPYPHDFYATNWLDLIQYRRDRKGQDDLFRSDIVPWESDSMKNNNLFRAEVNQAMLKICLLPDEYIEKFISSYMLPDGQEYVKNIKWKGKIGGIKEQNYVDLIKNRRDILMQSALKNESFRRIGITNHIFSIRPNI